MIMFLFLLSYNIFAEMVSFSKSCLGNGQTFLLEIQISVHLKNMCHIEHIHMKLFEIFKSQIVVCQIEVSNKNHYHNKNQHFLCFRYILSQRYIFLHLIFTTTCGIGIYIGLIPQTRKVRHREISLLKVPHIVSGNANYHHCSYHMASIV